MTLNSCGQKENSLMSLISIRSINHSAGIDNSVLEKVEANKVHGDMRFRYLTFKPEFHQMYVGKDDCK